MPAVDRHNPRPGGRSARVRADVHRAVTELLGEEAESLSIPLVAERAGVAATTVYRRWGDLDSLRTEVAMEVLTADGPVPDTGDTHRDLAIWCEFLVTDIARPERTSFLRTVVGSTKDETGKSHCLDKREIQIDTILRHARERHENPPAHADVMDHVVAPLYFRILFGLGGADVEYARLLVDRLFRGDTGQ
ncbi:TetR/AcrR family transcriptional regulator [Rhodococcoides yunnanense]|uniref:TetR/AcrR family transcriptional regulator n=1 Tax=Rhodococcoides yunnanense TaxID=278209 RepID=UPI0009348940|nr:TetR/AcrR family transcriptional regulator [Rhodococcus yunnanensis]